jgi:hypothetical protein
MPKDEWVGKTYDAALLKRLMGLANIDESHRREFTNLVRRWAIITRMFYENSRLEPTFKGVETDLVRVQNLSEQLVDVLFNTDVQHHLLVAVVAAAAARPTPDPAHQRTLDEVITDLEDLASLAKMAAATVSKKKPGDTHRARRNKTRKPAVEELAHIWKRFTGFPPHRRVENAVKTDSPRSYGPFQCFVYEALLPIFGESGVTGIDTDIRYACQRMAKAPTAKPPSYFHTRGFF